MDRIVTIGAADPSQRCGERTTKQDFCADVIQIGETTEDFDQQKSRDRRSRQGVDVVACLKSDLTTSRLNRNVFKNDDVVAWPDAFVGDDQNIFCGRDVFAHGHGAHRHQPNLAARQHPLRTAGDDATDFEIAGVDDKRRPRGRLSFDVADQRFDRDQVFADIF